MARLGVPATARASFALYNTREEIDSLVTAVRACPQGIRMSGPAGPLSGRHPRSQPAAAELPRPHGVGARQRATTRCAATVSPCYVRVEDGAIADVGFQGSGCAIAKASASLMTESVKGQTLSDASALLERFRRMMMAPPGSPVDQLGELAALAGVRQFPTRVKCATLAWHALQAAMSARDEIVLTE